MKTKVLRIVLLFVFVLGLFAPAAPVSAQTGSVSSKGVSPEGMLNAGGTLTLDGTFRGTLDLSGWSVEIDSERGPVFAPARSVQASATTDNWAALGEGGGVVDDKVWAIAVIGTDVYIGGGFTDLANMPAADYIAKWDGTNWSALSSNGIGNGALTSVVYSLAVSGTNLYVGGAFTQVYNGGTLVSGASMIAKWNTLTSTWSALGSNGAGGGSLGNVVTEVVVDGSNVYAGGYFTNVNNGGTIIPEADYVAKWDGANWSALGSNGAGDGSLPSGTYIGALAVNGSDVYVGGSFTDVNNGGTTLTAADYIAKWDGSNWSALSSNGSGNGSLNNTVYSLAVSGTDVYVGGQFSNVNNGGMIIPEADYLAKWNGSNWSALGGNGAGDGSLNNAPFALYVNGSDLYVGGSFTNVNNGGTLVPEADYIAKWNGTNWSAVGSNGAGDGSISKSSPSVLALAMLGSSLIVGGGFYDLNNGGTVLDQADFLAQWDGANWSMLGTDANGALVNGYSGSRVNAIAVIGTDVYVGGYFNNVSNHGVNLPEADYIAKWDGANWSALGGNGAGNGSLNFEVSALAVIGTDLYVGGRFFNVNNGGTPIPQADYIAKWDGANWSALGGNGAGNGSLPSGSYVSTLAVSGTDLYVGGSFANVNNGGTVIPEADYLAKWDGANWSAIGSNGSGNGALNAQVFALTFGSVGELYAGGGFTNAAAIPEADYIARWNGSSWSALGNNGASDGSLNNWVSAIAVSGSIVYAGGHFTNVNNGGTVLNAADYIARWDGANWLALGSNGMGNGSIGGVVETILANGSDIYVGGRFANVNNGGTVIPEADHIAHWNGANWSALGSNGAGDGSINGNNDIVYAMRINGTDLLVGGQFSNVNNKGTVVKEADYLAAYGFVDGNAPVVTSILRADPNPTTAASVNFTVTFSEAVTGVDSGDFTPTVTSGSITGQSVTAVTPISVSVYTVTVNTGTGSGTLRLDLNASGTGIQDLAGNPIAGGFTSGEEYTVQKTQTATFRSTGSQDGWVLESSETSNQGGSLNSTATTFRLGDENADKQYRTIISFNTASLPDTATITKVTLKIKKQGLVGTNPFSILGGLRVNIRKPYFGTSAALTAADFQAAASLNNIGSIPNKPVSGWYSKTWTSGAFFSYINRTGITQFRLYFAKDDNDDNGADYMSFYSGNYTNASARPTLIIEYYVP